MKSATVFSLVLLAGLAFSGNARAKDQGFSGKWVLDKHSPRPGNAPNNLETKIKQGDSGVTIDSTFKEPDNGVVPLVFLGVMSTNLRLTTDGAEQQNTIGPFQMASKTTVEGNRMLTDWTATVKDSHIEGHWTHTLSEDGKHMTLEIKEGSPEGQQTEATLYFVRK